MQFGLLHLWLLAESEEAAELRSQRIVAELPYHLVGPNFHVRPITEPIPDVEFARYAASAKFHGLFVHIAACEVGTDEAEFLEQKFE